MIIDKNETYIVTKINSNLLMLNSDLYFLTETNGINILICLNNENLIIASASTGIGISYFNGEIIGVKFTPSVKYYLLLETGDYMLLENDGKIILQRNR